MTETLEEIISRFPKPSRWRRFRWWMQRWFRWPQCPNTIKPYGHMTDEECEKSFLVSMYGNRKHYCCLKKKYHLGKCESIHGHRW